MPEGIAVGKHRYSEIKHPDRFIEALAGLWKKIERYVVPASIAGVVVVVGIGVWVYVARHYASLLERPWEERFAIMQEMIAGRGEAQDRREEYLGKLEELASKHRGGPVAAVTLLEVSQGYLSLAAQKRSRDEAAARRLLQAGADAAERFIAEFPDHRHVAVAHYQAGCAWLDLGEYAKAAAHFQRAARSPIRYVATLARWHLAYCREELGEYAEARRLYEALRSDPGAGWCADQAQFRLTQLALRARKGKEATATSTGAAQQPK